MALTLAVSGIASADQDMLKNFNATTEIRQGWKDIDKNDANANGIGNAGFKKNNRMRTRWKNAVSGQVTLVDEWGLDANFSVVNENDTNRGNRDGSIKDKVRTWETKLEFGKQIQLGSFDSRWNLGWVSKTGRVKSSKDPLTGAWVNDYENGKYHTFGQSNEIYVGPTFGINFFGQQFDAKLQAVYWNAKGGKSADYTFGGNGVVKGSNEGYGFNADFNTSGNIAQTAAGDFSYGVTLNNRFRDGNGYRADGKKAGSSVYLDYIVNLGYKTPDLGGFYGHVDLENEWEKHTAVNGYTNNASLWTGLGYKTGFDTAVGTVKVNPFVKYRPWHRETVSKDNNTENDRVTTEINEVRAGLNLGLEVK